MFCRLLSPFFRPITSRAGNLLARVRPTLVKVVAPENSLRRDFLRQMAGLPGLALAASGVGVVTTQTGCASGSQDTGLAPNESEVDYFMIGQTSSSGITLGAALEARAKAQGIQLQWHDSVAPDLNDCAKSIVGRRLVRWEYLPGTATDAKFYRFEVTDDQGYAIKAEPTLDTVLGRDYSVTVLEVSR